MNITILCSSQLHPINGYIDRWVEQNSHAHEIVLARNKRDARGGEILFLISCSELVDKAIRSLYRWVLVIHASDLPKGRGWSPHVWQILEGKEQIAVTLLEAEDRVDSGDIWHQILCHVPKNALFHEISHLLFEAELRLMDYAVANAGKILPRKQLESTGTYYRRRRPEDSRLDPDKTISEQFDLIRVCDPQRYPAFFSLRGRNYKIVIEELSRD